MTNKIKKAIAGQPIVETIYAKINDDLTFDIEGYNDDGTDYDWTGHTFHMQVKNQGEDTSAILDILDADFSVSGKTVTVLHGKSNMDITPKEYVYDIEVTFPSGIVQTIYEGPFIATQDVTR